MNEYYRGKIKVVGTDMMCFPADPLTLDALVQNAVYALCGPYNRLDGPKP